MMSAVSIVAKSLYCAVILLSLQLISSSNGEKTIFYISTNGVDTSDCGYPQENPCFSLEYVINLTSTGLSSDCYVYTGNTTNEIQIYLLEGEFNFLPICMKFWSNLTITGIGDVRIRSSLTQSMGILEFCDCNGIFVNNIRFISSIVSRAAIYADNTTGLEIVDCMIPVFAIASTGVWLVNPYGFNSIRGTRFFSNVFLVRAEDLTPSTALIITAGINANGGLVFESELLSYLSFYITVTNCTFEKLLANQETTGFVDNYRSSSTRSQAVLVWFQYSSTNSTIKFIDCLFREVEALVGSIALITYSGDSSFNTASFERCKFENNIARFGGGLAAYFINTASYNLFSVANCTFTNNEATFEGGGIFSVTLVSDPTNEVFINDCDFISNTALYGAGLFLFNDPTYTRTQIQEGSISLPLMNVSIADCQFRENEALVSEGVVNTLRIRLTLNGENILASNNGSAVVLRSSVLLINDYITFTQNKALTGGALKILDRSQVNMDTLVEGIFTYNEALFSGGAVYADKASTTVTADEYNHTEAANVLGICFIQFPSKLFNPQTMVYFSNNTAVSAGNDFQIFSIRSCYQSYFLPEPYQQFTAIVSGNPVVIETDNPLTTTSTGPSYLYFYGSSSKCYKPVGNITYLLPNCSHSLLMENFYSLYELECGINLFYNELDHFGGPGRGTLHPTVDQLILPWAGIEASWTQPVTPQRKECFESIPGDLTLSPSPGEQFDLTVQLADQILNFITGTVYLQLEYQLGVSPGVLLQLNGIQFAYTERIYFTPNRPLSELAIVGLPGAEGKLNIFSDSQILGLDIVLQIPFKLSQCPLGYYDPPGAVNIDEVNQLITYNYSTTQRIPINNPLACECFIDSSVKFGSSVDYFTSDCIAGYTVNLNSLLWAGLIPVNSSILNEIPTTSCLNRPNASIILEDTFSSWIKEARERQLEILGSVDPDASPVDVVLYNGELMPGGGAPVKCYSNYTISELVEYKVNGEFSVDSCTRGFCRGNAETTWYLSDIDYPCVENRQGSLCGQCKPGFSLTITNTKCKDCSNPRWYIPFLTTVILGLVLVTCAISFNLGVSPTLDSLLFFTQAVYIIVGGRLDYTSFAILSFFNLDFTFDQCVTSDLKALTRLILQYITPIYIIILLTIVLALTKIKGFSKYLGNHSFLQAMWLLVLLSYLNIANSTFEILHCYTIGPRNFGFSEFVLIYDASVICWSGQHLPWAIIAVLLAAFVIIPFPFYTGIAIRFPKLKPITDVYCSIYKDSRRYWVIWDLLRRIIIVMLGVFVINFILRHFFLLLASILVLVIFITTWPYKYWLDNAFGTFVSIALIVFCLITQPSIYQLVDPHRAISWTIVALVVFSGVVLLTVEVVLCFMSHKGINYTKDNLTFSKLKKTFFKLKEKLNFSKDVQFLELEESTSSDYFRQPSENYSQYREPLIDSGLYSPRISSNGRAKTTTKEDPIPDNGINTASTTLSIVTHSIV